MNRYFYLLPLLTMLLNMSCGQPRTSEKKETTTELSVGPAGAEFTLWSPLAEAVEIRLFDNGESGEPYKVVNMKRNSRDSLWHAEIPGNLYGKFYTFRIKEQGKWLDDTPGISAKAVGVNGKRAAIVDLSQTDPEGWENDRRPPLENYTDIVIYETHFRDFSIDSTSGIRNRGKFLSLTEEGSRSPQGEKTGIDHLKELGVTHVHLLPSFDFGSIDETTLEQNRYNWGYDPQNYNVPEGSYSTDPYTPEKRIREMKEMIQALHRNGIRVIMDVVYNHTYDINHSNFTQTAPGYYYRHNPDGSYSDASGCGNETASEKERMRRFIVESVKHWAEEYHIDGFRFDLMGIHDIETMNQVAAALKEIDPTIFVYGEGWTAGPSPYPADKRALKAHVSQMKDVAVFNDDLRDGVKGSFKDGTSKGFATGEPGLEESIKFGIVAATQHPDIDYAKVNYSDAPYAHEPHQSINYVSSHDDLCLTDKLIASNPGASTEQLLRFDKLAQTIVFTSQGVPFIFNGEEIFRSKQGVHNSYQSPDSINRIDWNNKTVYKELFDYYRKLIRLRKNHPAFRMSRSEDIRKNLHFLDLGVRNIVAYTLNNHANGDSWGEILVLFNGNLQNEQVDLPDGDWTIVCRDGEIDERGLGKSTGGKTTIPASSAWIMWK